MLSESYLNTKIPEPRHHVLSGDTPSLVLVRRNPNTAACIDLGLARGFLVTAQQLRVMLQSGTVPKTQDHVPSVTFVLSLYRRKHGAPPEKGAT